MSKNKLGEDSPFPKFMHLKIRRRDGVESLTILEEGEFKLAIDGCIKGEWNDYDCHDSHAYICKTRTGMFWESMYVK